MELDGLLLSRIQFAFTIMFHYIFPPLSIGLGVLLVMMLAFGFVPGWHILALPIFVLFAVAAAIGPALWLAALNARYRDFRFIVPFIVQFGLYISPVGFSSDVIPDAWRLIYSLNPAVSVIDGFRWCLLGGATEIYWPGLLAGVAVTALLLRLGLRAFRRTERSLADFI